MYENLEVVVVGVEDCRLTEKLCVLSVRVPPHYGCEKMRARISRSTEKRTMIWYRIDPFVQSGIKFGDNMLFPLLADKSK